MMRIAISVGLMGLGISASGAAQTRLAQHVQVVATAGTGTLPGQVVVAMPTLLASLPSGNVAATLEWVSVLSGPSAVSITPGRSVLQVAGPQGKYRVRFTFAFQSGVAATATSVSIHNGQLQSDPVVEQCSVTPANPRCEAVIDATSGWWLAAMIDSGNALRFTNIIVAPEP